MKDLSGYIEMMFEDLTAFKPRVRLENNTYILVFYYEDLTFYEGFFYQRQTLHERIERVITEIFKGNHIKYEIIMSANERPV